VKDKPVYEFGLDMLGGEVRIGVMPDGSACMTATIGNRHEERRLDETRVAELAVALSGGATARTVLTQAMRAALDSGGWDRVSRVASAIQMQTSAEDAARSAAAVVAYEARELKR